LKREYKENKVNKEYTKVNDKNLDTNKDKNNKNNKELDKI